MAEIEVIFFTVASSQHGAVLVSAYLREAHHSTGSSVWVHQQTYEKEVEYLNSISHTRLPIQCCISKVIMWLCIENSSLISIFFLMMGIEPYYRYFSNEKECDQQMQKWNTTTVTLLCPKGCITLNWEQPTFSKSKNLEKFFRNWGPPQQRTTQREINTPFLLTYRKADLCHSKTTHYTWPFTK